MDASDQPGSPSGGEPLDGLLDTIIAQSDEGIIVADERGVIRVFNPAAERQHGVPMNVVAADEWAETFGLVADDTGLPLPLAQTPLYRALHGERVRDARWGVRLPSGDIRTLAGTATPLFRRDGSLAGAVIITRDVTDEKRAEDERARLLASEKAARAVAEVASRHMSLLDLITRELVVDIQSPTRTLQRLTELLVPSLADWCAVYLPGPGGSIELAALANEDATKVQALREILGRLPINPALQTGIPAVLRTGVSELSADVTEEMLRHAARGPEHLAALLSAGVRSHLDVALRGHGGVLGVLSLTHTHSGRRFTPDDVTLAEQLSVRAGLLLEQARLFADAGRARVEAEAASRSKDEFLAMLGHELRNPLAPITTALELMKLRGEGSQTERAVIERQLGHVVRLVDDLLDVSRITQGKVELRRRSVEIASVVERAVETATALLEARRQRLELDVPRSGLTVSGDLARLTQVFANLLNNAAKYSPEGAAIKVRAGVEGDDVVVSVEDEGAGIDVSLLPHVFDLFAQGPQTLERAKGGLGLGLAIVRSLVELHGGTVTARSEGNARGSTFVVRLPVASRDTPEPPSRRLDRLARAVVPRRILVVDDNEDAAWLLGQLLVLRGHQTRVELDAPAALQALTEFRPELALLDIGLPSMSGHELARRIRQMPEGKHVLLVAVTGYGQESDRREAMDAGFDHHIVKPASLERIDAILEGFEKDRASERT
jgi:PAS domain S-box-containing protein